MRRLVLISLLSLLTIPYLSANASFAIHTNPAISYYTIQNKVISKKRYFNMQINKPQFEGKSPNLAKLNQIIQTKVNAIIKKFKSSLQTPKQLHAQHKISGLALNSKSNTLITAYKVFLHNPKIVSLRFKYMIFYYMYAHPSHYISIVNYNLQNNTPITLNNLFKANTPYLKTIASYCRTKLTNKIAKPLLAKAKTKPVKTAAHSAAKQINVGTKPMAKNYQYWNLTNKGILITFPTYQVAAGYYGPQEILVPYNIINKYLKIKRH